MQLGSLKASGNGTLDDATLQQSCSGAGFGSRLKDRCLQRVSCPSVLWKKHGKCRAKLPTELSTKGPLNEDVGRASRGLLM